MKKLLALAIAVLSAAHFSYAQKWTVDDVVNQESLSDAVFSDDNNLVAWVKRRPAPNKDSFASDIYLSRLNSKDKEGNFKTVQLTRGDESESNPVFSADGETIYFLSSKAKGKNLWALSLLGGEAYVVDSFDVSISQLKRLDATTLIFKAEEGKTLYESEIEKKKDNVQVIEDSVHVKPSRLFTFDIEKKKLQRVTDNQFPISSYAVSPDGKWAVTSQTMSPHYGVDGKPSPTHHLWNLDEKNSREILSTGYQTPGNFQFASDNSGFYFTSVLSSNPEWQGAGIDLLHFYTLSNNSVAQVNLGHDWGLGSGYDVAGSLMIGSLAKGAYNGLAFYSKNGSAWSKEIISAGNYTDHLSVVAATKNGAKLLVGYSTASLPTQIRVADIVKGKKGNSLSVGQELVKLNTHLEKKPMTKSEVITWTGALEEEVTGILYYPTDYEAGKKYPLVVAIHGGPSGVDMDRWTERYGYYPHMMAERGVFTLKPNYHGSSNHGQKFVESIKEHYYEYELPDIINGIEFLNQKGYIHKDSMAVMGWSNGAILATMLTVEHPFLFKVAAVGAGDVNWTSDYGNCQFGVTFDQSYFGGAPWDNRNGKIYNEAYILKSPLFEMEKVKTPTLIFHGSEDRAVPRDQSWEYYRALQQIGQADVRFLWFPGQPHGLQKITHQQRKMTEEIAWFDKYLWGKPDKTNEAFKKGSPLAQLISKEKASKTDGKYGELVKGSLIPETAATKKDSIAIGKFEVTNAQFKAHSSQFSYLAGQDNFPAVVSLEQAKAYVSWLSTQTDQTYRLPSTAEAKKLHELALKSAAKENTLSYWAGYNITIDELADFKMKMTEVKSSLLKEVGSFPASKVKEAEVYDLGGNVAEYASDGSTYGFGAYDFADEKAGAMTVDKRSVGFRVVRE
jgi:dipeptidyl aminopeptidase/acylaminoacyl peptidase